MKRTGIQIILFVLIGLAVGCSTTRNQGENATSGDRGGAAEPSPVDDATLTTKVKAKLLSDDLLNAIKIDVDTQNGTVFLSGVVDTPEQKRKAVQIAKNTEGVRKVEDNLKVGRFEGTSGKPGSSRQVILMLEDIG